MQSVVGWRVSVEVALVVACCCGRLQVLLKVGVCVVLVGHPVTLCLSSENTVWEDRGGVCETIGCAVTDVLLVDGGKRISTCADPNHTRGSAWPNGCLVGRISF